MEDAYTKCRHGPANNGNNHNACNVVNSRFINHAQASCDLPTATDMFPCGDTADKICPPTTQSIKEYPIIWIKFNITTILLGHQPIE